MKFRRRSRRMRAGKRELIWSRGIGPIGALDTSGAGLESTALIVQGSDWARAGGSSATTTEKGAVLLRTVVDWTVYITPHAAPPATLMAQGVAGFRRRDVDDLTQLSANTDWFSEDWMHSEGFHVQQAVAAVPTLTWFDGNQSFFRGHWDTKVKRKLTTEDVVEFSCALFSSAGFGVGPQLFVDLYTRALIQLP